MSEKYALIAAEKAVPVSPYRVVKMCAWLQVSTSGFYDHCDAMPSARALRRAKITKYVQAAFDLGRGFLVLEDLGDKVFGSEVARGRPLAELWGPAVDVLVALAGSGPPDLLPIEGHAPYRLPSYDAEAMATEASLLIDWLWPALHGTDAPPGLAEEFAALWRPHLAEA